MVGGAGGWTSPCWRACDRHRGRLSADGPLCARAGGPARAMWSVRRVCRVSDPAAGAGRAPRLGASPGSGCGLGRRTGAGPGQPGVRTRHRPGRARSGFRAAGRGLRRQAGPGVAILAVGLALSALVPIALLPVALPEAFVGYVFPTEYLGWLGGGARASCAASCPTSWRWCDRSPSARPSSGRRRRWPMPSIARPRPEPAAEQVRGAVVAYGTGVDLYAALRDVAAAVDLEELDELSGDLAQARHLGKGVGDVLAEHERGLRDGERNRRWAPPRWSSPSSPRSSPGSTCPSSCCSSCCPCSYRLSDPSEGGDGTARPPGRPVRGAWIRLWSDERGLTTLDTRSRPGPSSSSWRQPSWPGTRARHQIGDLIEQPLNGGCCRACARLALHPRRSERGVATVELPCRAARPHSGSARRRRLRPDRVLRLLVYWQRRPAPVRRPSSGRQHGGPRADRDRASYAASTWPGRGSSSSWRSPTGGTDPRDGIDRRPGCDPVPAPGRFRSRASS